MTEGYQALRHGAAWIDLSARGRIVARGRDRARLLHDITSNEVKKMTPGHRLLCVPAQSAGPHPGRPEPVLLRRPLPDRYRTGTAREGPASTSSATSSPTRWSWRTSPRRPPPSAWKARRRRILAALGAPRRARYSHPAWDEHTVAAVTVTGQPGVRIFCAAEQMRRTRPPTGSRRRRRRQHEDVRVVRIENGKPRYGEDIRETSLPQETQQMHAVSFTKGCYLGQEIVERIRAHGHVNKKLTRVVLPGAEIPAAGTKTTVDGAEAEVTSAVLSPSGEIVALAYVRNTDSR